MKMRNFTLSFCAVFFAAAVLLVTGGAFAAEPDAQVKGLWLRSPSFPKDAEVVKFEDNKDMDMVTYTRSVDGLLTFSIRRQPIEGSELQHPDDVPGLIEMWTNNDDTMRRVQIDTHAGVVLSELYTYPCAFVGYVTGRNEDMRENMGIFIFTDRYCFVVEASVAADWAMDYQERIMEWLATLEFVEGEGAVETSGAPGAIPAAQGQVSDVNDAASYIVSNLRSLRAACLMFSALHMDEIEIKEGKATLDVESLEPYMDIPVKHDIHIVMLDGETWWVGYNLEAAGTPREVRERLMARASAVGLQRERDNSSNAVYVGGDIVWMLAR